MRTHAAACAAPALLAAVLAAVLAGPAQAQPAPAEPTAEGSLWRHFFGNGLEQRGIKFFGYLQVGFAANDKSRHDAAGDGYSNAPIAGPTDEGLQLNQLALALEKPVKGNLVPRVTPLPGPVPQEADFGFRAELSYGRDGLPARMYGFDADWGLNRTRGGVVPGYNRQNYLALPQVYLQAYLPWWQGMALTLGRFGAGVGYEIPPDFRPSPNFFYSRTYAFVSQPDQVFGGLLSANVMRGSAGLLAAELGVANGRQNLEDNNDSKSVLGALRWRSPDMATWVNYSFMRGNEENQPGHPVQMPTARILSPRHQLREHHSLALVLHPAAGWEASAEGLWGRQKGDGLPGTVDLLTGNTFAGASWSGVNGQVLYRSSPTLQWGARLERFHDAQGFALFPLTAAPGTYTAATVGLKYDFSPAVVLRAEIRHDHRSGSGTPAFGGGRADQQTGFASDVVIYF